MPQNHSRDHVVSEYDAHKVLVVAYAAILIAGPSLGTMSLRSAEWPVFFACMVGTIIGLVGLIQSVRRINPLLWGKIYVSSLQAVILFSTIQTGGALSGAVGWLFTMPVVAAILVGTRWALINAAITGGAFLGLGIAHSVLGNWKRTDNLDEAALLASASHTLALVVLICMVILGGKRLARSQSQMRQARDEEQRANQAKSAFLANMSHEIRTPLNGIIGMAEIALEGKLPKKENENVQTILSCSKALLEILNDVLDISKIEAGSLTIESINYSPRELVADVRECFAGQTNSRGLTWGTTLSDSCPYQVLGDSTRVRQVIFNLVGNAIKFTQTGGIRLEVNWHKDSEELEFRVIDTGIGIPQDRQDSIFEEFIQADVTTTRQYGGTGLGLSISRRLVEEMGGSIQTQSEFGKGSCFSFTVAAPLGVLEQPIPALEAVEAATKEPEPNQLWSAEVLLVEDNAVNAKVAMHTLKKHGLRPIWAKNGIEAVEMVRNQGFDLILMDCQMPEMDGFEATGIIRAMAPSKSGIPIIALTAGAMNEDRQRCFDSGMNAYLSKPFQREEFERVLAQFLGRQAA